MLASTRSDHQNAHPRLLPWRSNPVRACSMGGSPVRIACAGCCVTRYRLYAARTSADPVQHSGIRRRAVPHFTVIGRTLCRGEPDQRLRTAQRIEEGLRAGGERIVLRHGQQRGTGDPFDAPRHEPGVDQGKRGPALGGDGLAGAVVAQVVEVDSQHDGGVALARPAARARPSARVLAAGAPIGVVAPGRPRRPARRWAPRATAAPTRAASAAQSSCSKPASDGDTAVTASTRSGPSASWAVQARKAESAPPLKATTTWSSGRDAGAARRGHPRRGRPIRRSPETRPDAGQHRRRAAPPCPCRRARTRRRGPRPGRSASCRRPP